MKPWECIDRVPAGDGDGELSLHRRDAEWVIRVDGHDLMSSRQHHSEDEIAELACAALPKDRPVRVCVGGLGLGFTLATVLRAVGEDDVVEVVESSPAVLRWNREWLGELAGHPLDDPRCVVVEKDAVEHLRGPGPALDAVILDLDNGPEALARPGNAWLYAVGGLRTIKKRLTRGGVLANWSAGPATAYTRALRSAGFDVEEHAPRSSRKGRGRRHAVWIARAR